MGNIDLRKQNKRNLILDLIRTRPRSSRASLRQDSGLAMKTVLQCVEGLLEENLILETGKSSPAVGRKATWLAINPDGCYWIGLKFKVQTITCATVDFAGNVCDLHQESIPADADAQEVLLRVCQCAKKAADKVRAQGKRLEGIGVGMPGMVNTEKGIGVLFVQIPGWENLPVRQAIEEAAQCPVYVEQSIRATALSCLRKKENLSANNLLYVLVRRGVGAAVLIDREPLNGHTNVAGEIGHMFIKENGALCSCGKRGCLESEICHSAITRRIRERMEQGEFKWLTPEQADTAALTAGVEAGKPDAVALWNDAMRQLCYALAPVVAALNPQKIIFSGEIFAPARFIHTAMGHFQKLCPVGACNDLSLTVHPHDEYNDAVGAACLSMYQTYGVWGASQNAALREEMQL